MLFVLVSDIPLLVLRFKIKLAGVQLPSDRNSSRTHPPTSNNPLLFPREKSLRAESNTAQKFSRIYSFAQIKEEGRGRWKQTKNLTGQNTGEEQEAFEKGRNEPATAGRRKMGTKESLKKWGAWGENCQEDERNGERRRETGGYQNHPLCRLQMKSPGPIIPSPHSQIHSPALPSSLSTAWIYY